MKKLLKKAYFLIPFFLSVPVYAQDDPPPTLGGGQLAGIADKVLEYLFPIAGIIALIFVIQGGYMWIISAGEPNRVKQAQGTLTWAIIGLVVVMVIFAVLKVLINFLS